jgi:acid phosphatase type 7
MFRIYSILLLLLLGRQLSAKTDRFRCIIRDEASTSICIAWDQISGTNPILYYGSDDYGTKTTLYPKNITVGQNSNAKGMNSRFVRLNNLLPNTVYYFVVADSEGHSKRYSFRTLPDDATAKLSIIVGAASNGNRDARRKANRLIAAMRPHFVIFNGNMTNGDSDAEWKEWLDDWAETIGADGRITALIPNRGSNEQSNSTIQQLFDLKNPDLYQAMSFAQGMFRIYMLNSNIAVNAAQRDWLERDLSQYQQSGWRIAYYHHSIRHNLKKQADQSDIRKNWGSLFDKYGVQLAFESDSSFARFSYPIRTSNDRGNIDGFKTDENAGTIYIGAAGWGSAKEGADYKKSLTFAAESFNHIHWLSVELTKIEIRTIKTDESSVDFQQKDINRFQLPEGLVFWNPGGLEYLSILNRFRNSFKAAPKQILTEIQLPKAELMADGTVELTWQTIYEEKGMRYRIFSSGNRQFWKVLAESDGLGQNNTKPNLYAFEDAPGMRGAKLFYRISAIDANGNEKSEIEIDARLLGSDGNMETIEINKTIGLLKTQVELFQDEATNIEITDTERNLVFTQKMPLKPGNHFLTFNLRHLKEGVYLFELNQGAQTIRKNIIITN